MAESIIVHFGRSDADKALRAICASFSSNKEGAWRAPEGDFSVTVRLYEHYLQEYEKEEQQAVEAKLAEPPNQSYEFEIRRSKSDEACDIIEKFIRSDLRNMKFLVDDMHDLYTGAEIDKNSHFLNQYRYKR